MCWVSYLELPQCRISMSTFCIGNNGLKSGKPFVIKANRTRNIKRRHKIPCTTSVSISRFFLPSIYCRSKERRKTIKEWMKTDYLRCMCVTKCFRVPIPSPPRPLPLVWQESYKPVTSHNSFSFEATQRQQE